MSIKDIYQAVMEYDKDKTTELTQAELDSGTDIQVVLNQGLIAPMDEVGCKFSDGKLFIPEMLMAAAAMKCGLSVIKPLLTDSKVEAKGTVVIGTVKGDLHDIGKNLVAMMMEGAGFEVIDLGVDVDSEKIVETIAQKKVDVVALSALLTTTMPTMQATVMAIKEAGFSTHLIIGGAPVTQDFADQIGADGYAADAPGAVQLVTRLLNS